MSMLQNILYGKKEGGSTADPIAQDVKRSQLRALRVQETGLKGFNKIFGDLDPKKQANIETQQKVAQATGGAKDQRRQLQANIARKGLGKSSIGQNVNKTINRNLGENISGIRAQRPEIERNLASGRAAKRLNLGSQVLSSQNAPIQFNDVKGKRAGGIGGILGGVVGGYFGGATGAKAGYQLGTGSEAYLG